MTAAEVQLNNILALNYEQRMFGRGDLKQNLAIFSRQCGIDPEFMPLAEARYQEFGGERPPKWLERCVITSVHRDFLHQAISAVKEIRQ